VQPELKRLRADPRLPPDLSIVIPVNAQGDLDNVVNLLGDLSAYSGEHSIEVILVVNNYPPDKPPVEIDLFAAHGVRVVSVPDLRRPGEAVALTARIHGLRAATAETAYLFDADCRIPNPSALLNWCHDRCQHGAHAVYAHVGFHGLRGTRPNSARLVIHHGGRWIKRVLLRIPTTRGGSYGVNCAMMIDLYDQGALADDMNVGPAFKAFGGTVVYSGDRELMVLTSGRMHTGRSWLSLLRHYIYRIRYNLRVLPVRRDAARHTGREKDPVRRFENNIPVS
jgi:hypothetical protein